MSIRIPSAHHEPLRQLIRMREEDFSDLVAALRSAVAVIDPDDLITRVQTETKLGNSAEPILNMLMSMIRVSKGSHEEFSEMAVEASKEIF